MQPALPEIPAALLIGFHKIAEACELSFEGQINRADRPVALLADENNL